MENSKKKSIIYPNFFIVGAPKCGTTAMFDYLRQQRDIFSPQRKEYNYFCSDLTIRNSSSLFKFNDETDYLRYFSKRNSEKIVGEASVWYLYSKVSAEKIYKFNPSAKILIMLRNPVDMLHSLHSQLVFSGDECILYFEDAILAIEDRKKGIRLPNQYSSSSPMEGLYYLDVAKYSGQVKRFIDIFGKDNLMVILYDDFTKSPRDTYLKVLDFLGVQACEPLPSFKIVNANKRINSLLLWRIRNFPPFWTRSMWRNIFPSFFRGFVLKIISRFNTHEEPRIPMNSDTRNLLQRELAPDIKKLSKIICRDLTHWMRN